jgi:hypothetical protein
MTMGLNLKDDVTVALVAEVARRLGTTKTGAVRELARQKLAELDGTEAGEAQERSATLLSFLETEIWPQVAGKSLSKGELEKLLGYDEMVG